MRRLTIDRLVKCFESEESHRLCWGLVIPNYADFNTFMQRHGTSFEVCHVSDLLGDVSGFLPMPEELFRRLHERVATSSRTSLLLGLDGYLALLSDTAAEACFRMIVEYMREDGGPHISFLFRHRWSTLEATNLHPAVGQRVVVVPSDEVFSFSQLTFDFIPVALSHTVAHCQTLRTWLRKMEDWETSNEGRICVCVEYGETPFPSLSKNVRQLLTNRDVFEAYQGIISPSLSDKAVDFILAHMRVDAHLLDELRKRFKGKESVLEQFLGLRSNQERELYLWMLRHTAPEGSYLASVLADPNCSADTFVRDYVKVSRETLERRSAEVEAWARERHRTIMPVQGVLHVKNALIDNLTRLTTLPAREAVRWMRFDLDGEEDIAWARRLMRGELDICDYSERLAAYFGDFPNDTPLPVKEYFARYRLAKFTNTMDAEWREIALQGISDAQELRPRSVYLRRLSEGPQCRVIVIDALGAEYLPFLCHRLREIGVKIDEAIVARSNLPTLTRFNDISKEWEGGPYTKVQELDNALHEDPKMGEEARQLMTNLILIEKCVSRLISEAFQGCERVVLTSDHGASRLAVLAWRMKLMDEIDPSGLELEGWRTAHKTNPTLCSNSWKEGEETGWVSVCGYGRFRGQGKLGFEAHGGATLEEMAVPIIVCSRQASESSIQDNPVKVMKPRLVENEGFDFD